MKCNWCSEDNCTPFAEGKKYCVDCGKVCFRECVTCHKPYTSAKSFEKSERRCNSCETRCQNAKLKRKAAPVSSSSEDEEEEEEEEEEEIPAKKKKHVELAKKSTLSNKIVDSSDKHDVFSILKSHAGVTVNKVKKSKKLASDAVVSSSDVLQTGLLNSVLKYHSEAKGAKKPHICLFF
jgi:hypothetical protein